MKDRWLVVMIVLLVLFALASWWQIAAPDDTDIPVPPLQKEQAEKAPHLASLRPAIPAGGELVVPQPQPPGVRLVIRDQVSGRVLKDRVLTIRSLGLVKYGKQVLPESITLEQLKPVVANFRSSLMVQKTQARHESDTPATPIMTAELEGSRSGGNDRLVITVACFAKLLVEVVFPPRAAERWRCEVTPCRPVPDKVSGRRREFFQLMRRVPRAYRRALDRLNHIRTSDGTIASVPPENSELVMFLPGEGEHFVEVTFDRILRGVGAVVELTRGEETRVVLEPRTVPLVAGILVDAQGRGVPDAKILVEGRGPLRGQNLLIPHLRESCGFVKQRGEEEMMFTVTRYAWTDRTGRFSIPLTLTRNLTLEAYVEGKGGMAREFELGDDHTSITDLTLVLGRQQRPEGLVRLTLASGEEVDLTKERIKITGVTGQAGSYSPIVGVDEAGWLDTRWLERGRKYRGCFRSSKYRPFVFTCESSTVVALKKTRSP